MKHAPDVILARVIDVIGSVSGATPSEITMDADLVRDLGCDSMDVVEIVMELEEAFDFAIDDDRADAFTHVRDVVAYLQAEIGESRSSEEP